MTMKVVRDSLHSRKCAIRSFAEPVGVGIASSNSIYVSFVKIGPSFSGEWVSYTSCILYFVLASRRHLSIVPKYPNIDPRPKLAEAPSRIVIALNQRCCMCDNFPIREKPQRPMTRSNRAKAVVKHLHEREIMFDQNCSQQSNDIGGVGDLGDFSGFDINGSPAPSYGGGWVSGRDDDILKRKAYTTEEAAESVRVPRVRKEVLGIRSMRILGSSIGNFSRNTSLSCYQAG